MQIAQIHVNIYVTGKFSFSNLSRCV